MRYYTLDADKNPVPCNDFLEGAIWFDKEENRLMAWDVIGDIDISTIFLWIDHSYGRSRIPVLFETMLFDNTKYHDPDTENRITKYDQFQQRHCTYAEAMAFHKHAVETIVGEQAIN